MRKIIERSLRQAGLGITAVLEAGNGADALTLLAENRVDLILCDINMPVMNGLEFVKQLSGIENARGIPIVMITAEGSESQVVQALAAGARGYIRKTVYRRTGEGTRPSLVTRSRLKARRNRRDQALPYTGITAPFTSFAASLASQTIKLAMFSG
jgi:two-component system chemotaxis response regulator CheY